MTNMNGNGATVPINSRPDDILNRIIKGSCKFIESFVIKFVYSVINFVIINGLNIRRLYRRINYIKCTWMLSYDKLHLRYIDWISVGLITLGEYDSLFHSVNKNTIDVKFLHLYCFSKNIHDKNYSNTWPSTHYYNVHGIPTVLIKHILLLANSFVLIFSPNNF